MRPLAGAGRRRQWSAEWPDRAREHRWERLLLVISRQPRDPAAARAQREWLQALQDRLGRRAEFLDALCERLAALEEAVGPDEDLERRDADDEPAVASIYRRLTHLEGALADLMDELTELTDDDDVIEGKVVGKSPVRLPRRHAR